ncbi:MAG: ABC transporter substrate-binding protein [Deltaproteobacteria bacterium]|nr:ABC transporter substrate-binding protein [Deltaproteobacteria bacterium]
MLKSVLLVTGILIGAIWALQAIPMPAYATSHEAKQQALIEAAKKEGVVNILATWPPKEANAIFEAFKKAYPFIKIRQTILSGREGFERIRAEFASGRRATDLINASFYDLEVAGMLQPWKDWFEIFPDTRKTGVHPSLTGSLEPSAVKGLMYRTDLAPRDLQPLTYAKLSDPRLSGGRIAFNFRQYYHYAHLYPKWSDEEIIRYAKEVLVPQKPKLCNGGAACWEMLVRGEVWAIPALQSHQYFGRYLPKGIVNIAMGADDAPVDEGKPILFLKDAPNSNAAKVFLHWATTGEVQEIFYKFRGRADPYDPNNIVGAWVKKHGAKLFDHPESEREGRSRELGAMVLRMLGLPVPKK